jgi:hypothetical protein
VKPLQRLGILLCAAAAGCSTTTTPARPHQSLMPLSARMPATPNGQAEPSTIPSHVVTPRHAAVASPLLSSPSDQMARSAELLASLYQRIITRREAQGVTRFILHAPYGPGATHLLAGLDPTELKTRVLTTFESKSDLIAWESSKIVKDPSEYPISKQGQAEDVFIDIDWVSPQRESVHAIVKHVGEVRAGFERVVATWTGAAWSVREAKPGVGW